VMNERIKELALQAGLEMCSCGCDMPTRQSAKFAELIVTAVMAEVRDEVQYEYDWTIAEIVTERVKKAFGVQ
jgi:hypothetical protein